MNSRLNVTLQDPEVEPRSMKDDRDCFEALKLILRRLPINKFSYQISTLDRVLKIGDNEHDLINHSCIGQGEQINTLKLAQPSPNRLFLVLRPSRWAKRLTQFCHIVRGLPGHFRQPLCGNHVLKEQFLALCRLLLPNRPYSGENCGHSTNCLSPASRISCNTKKTEHNQKRPEKRSKAEPYPHGRQTNLSHPWLPFRRFHREHFSYQSELRVHGSSAYVHGGKT
ncbi:hypothetical protein SAMN05216370_0898 [Pseudomonas peli]|uniref:Uncharacterized protein n=1 Tax=Pseudomonas peli TaxID=592361 RepID=A0AB37Z3V7_9PSED|nr:hypothetical protein SAMN05216370_0898 [Pseudomonas peli]